MVYELQYLIVADMPRNVVPSMPPNNNMKASIGSAEAMKSSKIYDS